MTCWFSATAITPELSILWQLSAGQSAWLTNAVQLGFVLGALISALINLPDIVRMSRLIGASAVIASVANAVLLLEPGFEGALLSRFVTGIALAGIYPPAMKLMATWFIRGRGLAMGALIGALTLGSSLPHLFREFSAGLDWQLVVIVSSMAAIIAAMIFGILVQEGPNGFERAHFEPRRALSAFREKPLLLANLGYFGHMWELYAMWAWILAFASAAPHIPFGSASFFAFIVMAAGAVGATLGGLLADRIGRCLTTAGMMVVSAACAVLIGFAFDGPLWFLGLVAVIWGISIVGDSAQFSAAITELADSRFVGTALTMQVSIGFALTVVTIWAMPLIADWIGGWQWAFLFLLPGPIVGAWAMLRLRTLPEAERLANGRR